MPKYISAFCLVTLLPTALLVLGALFGGFWPWAALILLALVNHLVDAVFENRPDNAIERTFTTILPLQLAVFHFVILGLTLWAISTQPYDTATKAAQFFATGLYLAAVSNANGHELIHRTNRLQFTLGKWIFISHLFGHHTSAHRFVHHPYVATKFDPNTARFNESFYAFFLRAWRGSFFAGLAAENTRRGRESHAVDFSNPYFTYLVGNGLFLGLVIGFFGPIGLVSYLGLCLMAQGGLLLTDYVQHYGLLRQQGPDGKFPPIAPHHSWNAPHWLTRHLTLNAPLHSDHHAKPARPFTELQNHSVTTAPQLPYSPGLMSVIALNPIRWRRIMNPRVAQWAARYGQ